MNNQIRYTCQNCGSTWTHEYEVRKEQKSTYDVIFFERIVNDVSPINDAICHICDRSAEAMIMNPMPPSKRTFVRVRLLVEVQEA